MKNCCLIGSVICRRYKYQVLNEDNLINDNATSGIGDVNLGFMLTYHEL